MTMTIAELIELLRTYTPRIRVVVDGYYEVYDDLSPNRVFVKEIALNTGKQIWQGKHIDPPEVLEKASDELEIVKPLAFHRESH